jgi:hypothetical protein
MRSSVLVIDDAKPHEQRTWRRTLLPLFRRSFREPLVHFLLIGFALFGTYDWLHRGELTSVSRQIVLTLDDLQQLNISFESQWQRPATPDEFSRMVEDKVQEEILYREGLAMGLDKDDTIVRRRMAQKVQFLAEDVAAAHEPTTKELKAWYQKNGDKFAMPSRVSFRHLYFSPDRRGQRTHDDSVNTLTQISGQPEDSRLAASLADPFMLQDYYADRAPEQLAKEFGPEFAQAISNLKSGSWQGPIESGYGWHLVFVTSLVPGRIPAFEEVEADVKTAWLGDQKQQAWRKAYDTMRAKYTVLLPAPSDKESTPAPLKKEVPTSSGEGPM